MRDSKMTTRLFLAFALAGVVGCNVAVSVPNDETGKSDAGSEETDGRDDKPTSKPDGGSRTQDAGHEEHAEEDAGTSTVPVVGGPCDLVAQDCATGAGSCMLMAETDGGIASRCITGCSLVAQDCPTDSKCAYVGDPATGTATRTCGPEGTVTEGAPCGAQGTDDCAKGLICITAQGATTSVCAKFCNDTSECDTDMQCTGVLQVPGLTELPVVCQAPPPACDPFAQDCTGPGEGCFLTAAGPSCAPAGTVADGQACTNANACLAGSACAGGFCRQVCNVASPVCTTGACQGVQVPGVTGAGICL